MSESDAPAEAAPFSIARPIFFIRKKQEDEAQEQVREAQVELTQAVAVPLPVAPEPASAPGPAPALSALPTRGEINCWWRRQWGYAASAFNSRQVMSAVARVLLAIYFVNLVVEQVEIWVRLAHVEPVRRWADDPAEAYHFPYIWVLVVLPATLAVATGFQVFLCGWVLLGTCVLQDAYLLWRQLVNTVWYGARPNELIVKRLAVTGAALLVLADAVRGPKLRSYAGLLFHGEEGEEATPPGQRRRMASWRSALLLVARLAFSALLLYSGIMQALRVYSRGTLWPAPDDLTAHPYGVHDSHDNAWQLLQLALAIPLVFGFKTKAFCRVLAAVLVCEAISSWPPWSRAWPTWWYSAHVRLHFCTNTALAGALMLLQSSGPGVFAVDELLTKQE